MRTVEPIARLTSGKKPERVLAGRAREAVASGASESVPSVQRCACGGGCPRCKTKSVERFVPSAPGDTHEREADSVAQALLAGSPARVSSAVLGGRHQPNIPSLRDEELRAPGRPLDAGTRAYFEPRLNADLSDVRVHTDERARGVADKLSARAFTFGRDVWFGSGEHSGDRALLAHELVHTVQQGAVAANGARRGGTAQGAAIQRQERRAAAGVNVVVIGAPGPGEIDAGHPYQFVNAAIALGGDPNTVWFVEQTGYAQGKVDPRMIERMAPGRLVWITPERKLVDELNALGPQGIASMHLFSHGLAGQVTLRYGWDKQGLPNYGFALKDVSSLRQDLFVPSAPVRFDSCNTGTSDWYAPEGNLAQAFADRTGRAVIAWTGRTSYSEVNRAAGSKPAEVTGSQFLRGRSPDWSEAGSRLIGREPRLRTFAPATGPRVSGFTSDFSMTLRLAESRKFEVPANGAVVVTCADTRIVDPARDTAIAPDPVRVGSDTVKIAVHREVDWGSDETEGTRSFPIDFPPHAETWSNLSGGTYYLEIWRDGNTNFVTKGDIVVDIRGSP